MRDRHATLRDHWQDPLNGFLANAISRRGSLVLVEKLDTAVYDGKARFRTFLDFPNQVGDGLGDEVELVVFLWSA